MGTKSEATYWGQKLAPLQRKRTVVPSAASKDWAWLEYRPSLTWSVCRPGSTGNSTVWSASENNYMTTLWQHTTSKSDPGSTLWDLHHGEVVDGGGLVAEAGMEGASQAKGSLVLMTGTMAAS